MEVLGEQKQYIYDAVQQQAESLDALYSSDRQQALSEVIKGSSYLSMLYSSDQKKAIRLARAGLFRDPKRDNPDITAPDELQTLKRMRSVINQLEWKYWTKDLVFELLQQLNGIPALERIFDFEKVGVTNLPELLAAHGGYRPMQLLSFTCPFAFEGTQDISELASDTSFFRYLAKRELDRFLQSYPPLVEGGVEMIVLLDDLEIFWVWGWEQTEELQRKIQSIKTTGQIQLDRYSKNKTNLIRTRILRMSEFNGYEEAFTRMVLEVRESQDPLITQLVKNETIAYKMLSRALGISFENFTETAIRSVTSYLIQGVYMEEYYPNGIYVQLEQPLPQRDMIYQPKRKRGLPIIHPVKTTLPNQTT